MAEVWTWGNVESKVRGGLEAFIQLCNVRFKRLEGLLRQVQLFLFGWVTPEQFGAIGNGAADDVLAWRRALAFLKANGGGILLGRPGATYKMTTVTTVTGAFGNIGATLDTHLHLLEADGILVDLNGSTIDSTATSGTTFLFDGCRNFGVKRGNFTGEYLNDADGYTELTLGTIAVTLASTTRESWNGAFEDLRCDDMFVGVACGGDHDATYRVRNMAIRNLYCDTGRYGVQCGNNGDQFVIENLRCSTVKRTYFVYGVDSHRVDLLATGGRAYNPLLIKAYERDTTNLSIRARVSVTSFPSKVSFDSEHTVAAQATPARIVGVDLWYDDTGCTNNSGTAASTHHGIDFIYHRDGSLTSTSSNQLFDRIRIAGTATGTLAHASETPVLQSPVGDGDFSKLYANPTGGGNTVEQAMAAWGFTNTLSGPVIVDGRLTSDALTAGGNSNAIGPQAPTTDVALQLNGTPTTGTTQYGAIAEYRNSSPGTTLGVGLYVRHGTAAGSFTTTEVQSLRVANPVAGSGTTITRATGLRIEDITSGGTTNYALQVGTGNVGFHGVTPIARPSALTQTYSTADRTLAAYTPDSESGAYTGVDNLQAGTPYATVADLNALRVAYENLRAFTEDLAQHHNAVVDDLQAYGLEQ